MEGRVFLVTATYWPGWGGAEGQCRLLAAGLQSRGIPVTVVTRRLPGTGSADLVDGVPVRRLLVPRGKIGSLWWVAAASTWIRAQVRTGDVIQGYQLLSPALVGLLSRGRTQRLVIRVSCSGSLGDVAEILRRPLPGLRRRLLRRVDAFVTLNKEMGAELAGYGLARVRCWQIPSAVDLRWFRPAAVRERLVARRALGLPDEASVALFCGRLVPQKGLDILQAAWEILARRYSDARLLVVGSGPERARIEAARIPGVAWLGPQVDVRPFYWAADLYVSPSRAEGMSSAMLEAMASGLPVIATRVGGTEEVLTHGEQGLLVPKEDSVALAAALDCLLGNAEMRRSMAEQARSRAERFGVDATVERYLDLYHWLWAA